MTHRQNWFHLLLAGLPLLCSGCLAAAIAESREDQVMDLARFHSRCDKLKVADRTMASRFVLEGCGYRYIYSCRNRPADSLHQHYDDDVQLAGFFLTGGLDPEAECRLLSASRLIPKDGQLAALTPAQPAPPPAAPAPASQPASAAQALPRAPSAAAIKQVLSALEPQLKSCGVPAGQEGRFQVQLRVAPSGQLRQVKITPAFDPEVQRCVELLLLGARLPPFQGEAPLTMAYFFHLR